MINNLLLPQYKFQFSTLNVGYLVQYSVQYVAKGKGTVLAYFKLVTIPDSPVEIQKRIKPFNFALHCLFAFKVNFA